MEKGFHSYDSASHSHYFTHFFLIRRKVRCRKAIALKGETWTAPFKNKNKSGH